MAFLETTFERLAQIDSSYSELKKLVSEHRQRDPEIETWWSHFSCAWDELVRQMGWPGGLPNQGFLRSVARVAFQKARGRRAEPIVFSSPIFGASSPIGMPFPPSFATIPTAFGFKICATGRDMWHPLATGHYSTELSESLITACLARFTDCFVDVGANIGFFSFLFASEAPSDAQVISCEPSTDNARLLLAGIEENGLSKRVRILQVAIGEREGQAKLHLNALGSGGNTVVDVNGASFRRIMGPSSASFPKAESVEITTLDTIVRKYVRGRRTLVKIDVEGYEKQVFAGAADWLSGDAAPILLYEAWPNSLLSAKGRNHLEVGRILENFGYKIWKVERPSHGGTLVETWAARGQARASETGNYLAIPQSHFGIEEQLPKIDTRVFGDLSRLLDLQRFVQICLNHVRERVGKSVPPDS